MEKHNNLLKSKIIYTFIIILIYLVGKGIPLYMIDVSVYLEKRMNAETLLMQTLGGDINQCSIFALGISPYMISSIFVQVILSLRGSEYRKRTSPVKTNKLVMELTLLVAMFMAIVRVHEISFDAQGRTLVIAQIVAVIEMITGAMLIIYLSARNKKFGIGGQSALIFVNIIDGILGISGEHSNRQLLIPMMIGLVVMIVMVIMENGEMRRAVQRISIHNIYADKNYLAIKLNPIGIMPAMFSTAFFMIPQFIANVVGYVWADNSSLVWIKENMVLTKPLGVGMYALILYVMTVVFSRIILNPSELTEQFLKSGDSIQDLHAGKDTKKYLSKAVTIMGMVSATVMSICLCIPLLLQLNGVIEQTLMMVPSSIMMLTGIGCNLYSEVVAVRNLEAYKPFI